MKRTGVAKVIVRVVVHVVPVPGPGGVVRVRSVVTRVARRRPGHLVVGSVVVYPPATVSLEVALRCWFGTIP